MFVWDMYKDAVPFSENEDRFIKRYLEILQKECPKDGAFLNQLNLSEVQFNWAPKMTQENGIMGAWSLTSPNKVFMAPMPEDLETNSQFVHKKLKLIKDKEGIIHAQWISTPDMATVVVHELIHKLQFHTNPIFFCVNRLVTLFVDHIPYLERIGIEYDARKNSETEELTDFYEKMSNVIDPTVMVLHYDGPLDIDKNERLKVLIEPSTDPETGKVYPAPNSRKYLEYAIELVKIFC